MTGEHGPVQTWATGQQAWLERWYRETRDALLTVDDHPRGPDPVDVPTGPIPAVDDRIDYAGVSDWPAPAIEPLAATAGEQDHSDPWRYAGEPADPPREA